jgi:hypothetical protein
MPVGASRNNGVGGHAGKNYEGAAAAAAVRGHIRGGQGQCGN